MKTNVLIIVGLLYLFLTLIPMSFWYEVGEVEVWDAVEGQTPIVETSGRILRDFKGSYTVVIKDSKNEIIVDADGGPFSYSTVSKRPEGIDLEWWANGDLRVSSLSVGTYSIITCWEMHDVFYGIIPNKHICSDKSFFRIEENTDG